MKITTIFSFVPFLYHLFLINTDVIPANEWGLEEQAIEQDMCDSTMLHYDGTKWTKQKSGTNYILFIHDPQPIALIKKKAFMPNNKWIWRCHIDVSTPNKQVWDFLTPFIHQYDGAVFSAPGFSQPLPIRQFLISPSIDPLSDKNKDLPQETIDNVLEKYHIPKDKPIITQISRFDYLKDPVGVIEAYRLVKKRIDCQLIIAGGDGYG